MATIEKFITLSTGHLSIQTRNWLLGMRWKAEGPSGGELPDGWFLYAHDDNECSFGHAAHAPASEFPADLWACFQFARAQRCYYVRFDCDEDVDETADLRSFDDTPAPLNADGVLEVDKPIIDLRQEVNGWNAIEAGRYDTHANMEGYATLEEAQAALAAAGLTARKVEHLDPVVA